MALRKKRWLWCCLSMRRGKVPGVIMLVCLAAGCGKPEGYHRPDDKSASTVDQKKAKSPNPATDKRTGNPSPGAAEKDVVPDKGDPFAGDDRRIRRLVDAEVAYVKPLSARSLSVKLTLRGGERAVFKPMLENDGRARYEVAAYRMARHLGVHGPPPATMRSLGVEFIALRLEKTAPELAALIRQRAPKNERGQIAGAMIAWIDDIDPAALKALGGRPAVMSWLSSSGPSAIEQPLAREASRMVTFDYVTGNWDRFSGGNLFVSRDRRRFVLLDHNGAFFRWADKRRTKMDNLLKRVERFSASLVQRVRGLSAQEIEGALVLDPWHRSRRLLTRGEVDLILERRDALVRHVDRLTEKRGENRVLTFP
jgi:hypothetical protein